MAEVLAVVGAVASVVQLADTAFKLSKTLYSFSSAVATASEDIKALSRDLEVFGQSLTLLSKLLDDGNANGGGKSRYSDAIYLLTSKIIEDCAEIYVKIDKLMEKLRKNSLKTRLKWLYKEKRIAQLMTRLGQLKATLMTVLMSLQVDMQLSMLTPSRSAILQVDDVPLQQETLEKLQYAQAKVHDIAFTKELELHQTSDFKNKGITPSSNPSSINLERSTSGSTLTSDPVMMQNKSISDPFGGSFDTSAYGNFKKVDNDTMSIMSFATAMSVQPPADTETKSAALDIDRHRAWREEMARTAESHLGMSPERAKNWAWSLPLPGGSDSSHNKKVTKNGEKEEEDDEEEAVEVESRYRRRRDRSDKPNRRWMDIRAEVDDGEDIATPYNSSAKSDIFEAKTFSTAEEENSDTEETFVYESSVDHQTTKPVPGFIKRRRELEETHATLLKSRMSAQQRGERSDSFIDKSAPLSSSSKMFYAQAKIQKSWWSLPKFWPAKKAPEPSLRASPDATSQPLPGSSDPEVKAPGEGTEAESRDSNKISMPGSFDDDLDSAEEVGDRLQESLFYSRIVLDDHQDRRRSSRRLDEDTDFLYLHPFAETVSDLGILPEQLSKDEPMVVSPLKGRNDLRSHEIGLEVSEDSADKSDAPKVTSENLSDEVPAAYSTEKPQDTHKDNIEIDNPIQHARAVRSGLISLRSLKSPRVLKSGKRARTKSHSFKPSLEQMTNLWWRAYSKVQVEDVDLSVSLQHVLQKGEEWPQTPGSNKSWAEKTTALVDGINLGLEHNKSIRESSKFKVVEILDVLKIIKNSLGFETAAIAWTVLSVATIEAQNWTKGSATLADIGEIVIIVARYAIMENLYRSTPGLTLRDDYQESLISMSALILKYLMFLITRGPLSEQELSEAGNNMQKIRDAEQACRNFVVVVDTQEKQSDPDRFLEDISEESEEEEEGGGKESAVSAG